jgi:hypothetical protein
MKRLGLALISIAASAAMLVACGGGGDGPRQPSLVAANNLKAPITAQNVGAITGQGFTFNSGVAAFGTASPTTVTLNSASSFSITSNEGTASGTLGFGSCIFAVTQSTYPASSPLAVNKTLEVSECSINVATAGVSVTQDAILRAVAFLLGTDTSADKNLTVDITPSGIVVVNGTEVGTVTLQPVTGGSSQ